MKCDKCGNNTFYITVIDCCDDCSANQAWDAEESEYVSDEKIIHEKELIRDHVANEGECDFSYAYGAGCHMYTCCKCKHKSVCPTSDGC
jgi:hypothetical protein